MNLFGILRPKWQHPDAAVRAAAMAALDDQALLAEIVERDESDTVRLAALQRLTDQAALARIARSNNPFNAHALGGITDEHEIVDVARTAEAPQVRRLAVDRIADPFILNQIVAFDDDASVRQDARIRRVRLGVDPMRYFLASLISNLKVTATGADRVADHSGDLDAVCGALVCDRRYQINGVLLDRGEEAISAPSAWASNIPAHASAINFSLDRRGEIELVAARCDGEAEAGNSTHDTRYYRIKIWRTGENLYHASVEQRRAERIHNVAVWSASSGGSEETFIAGATSVRVE